MGAFCRAQEMPFCRGLHQYFDRQMQPILAALLAQFAVVMLRVSCM
jgi:hypothetical protein